ncbi:MAG: hypothetical protein JXR77_04920, partial [Lentisphaeria bacterium]|nr:hypothetical protein [Lentisphaeria bacterium]
MKRLFVAVLAASPWIVRAGPAAVLVEGYGFETAEMREGATAFANRDYTWKEVPESLHGWRFTRCSGGVPPRLRATARGAGEVTIATALTGGAGTRELTGWEAVRGLHFRYTAKGEPVLRVFRRHLRAGTSVDIPQLGWTGTIVLAPALEAAIVEPQPDLAAVPGVVIDHSPAWTRDYIGCPAIAVLRPGVYLASHSFFGGGRQTGNLRLFRS